MLWCFLDFFVDVVPLITIIRIASSSIIKNKHHCLLTFEFIQFEACNHLLQIFILQIGAFKKKGEGEERIIPIISTETKRLKMYSNWNQRSLKAFYKRPFTETHITCITYETPWTLEQNIGSRFYFTLFIFFYFQLLYKQTII